ncbi:MAG: hypothetical protein UZ18_ATM001000739 [Armatimonadetes bacterium OLB18]|nr:MAG: hypothetical protein UZ18_ATM001000739 [Armatimonadetes bacterium OLB18]
MSRSTRDQLHPTVLSSRNGAGVRLLEPDAPRKRWIAGDLALRVRVFGESQPEDKVDLLRWYDLPSLNGRVRSIVLHPEGTHAFCAVGRHVCCVDLSSLSVVWRASGPRVWGFIRSSPFALGLTSEGSLLASYDSGHLQWIDPEGKVRSLAYENDAPLRFVMLPGGRQFLGTDGRKVGVWDIDLRVRIAGFEPTTWSLPLRSRQRPTLHSFARCDRYRRGVSPIFRRSPRFRLALRSRSLLCRQTAVAWLLGSRKGSPSGR